ncbi:hypothetical protein OGAPHI_003909 [Ogataea philodendri]|uniref:Uncharacterized protein n=1 Tax=Ogataea philodendri TaxID=1378263 RepID=A0A9P8T5B2_9ASCO|nr:uncharacterized protein OGAPHI_003909 [Ogataea philodendri]KAH3665721.1 hypothetical protein OGAPHI_003909 [Ogataea philodendri]
MAFCRWNSRGLQSVKTFASSSVICQNTADLCDFRRKLGVKNGLRDDDDDSLVIDWFSCGFVENEWSGSLTEASGETSLGPASSYDNLNSDRFGLGDLRASDGMGGREEVDLLNTSAGFIRVSGDPDRLFVGEPVGVPDTDI